MPFTSKNNPNTKLTPTQVQEIKTHLQKGVAVKDLAYEYGVNPSTISRIKRKKTWKGDPNDEIGNRLRWRNPKN